jgi:hypothetical protein
MHTGNRALLVRLRNRQYENRKDFCTIGDSLGELGRRGNSDKNPQARDGSGKTSKAQSGDTQQPIKTTGQFVKSSGVAGALDPVVSHVLRVQSEKHKEAEFKEFTFGMSRDKVESPVGKL